MKNNINVIIIKWAKQIKYSTKYNIQKSGEKNAKKKRNNNITLKVSKIFYDFGDFYIIYRVFHVNIIFVSSNQLLVDSVVYKQSINRRSSASNNLTCPSNGTKTSEVDNISLALAPFTYTTSDTG